MWQTIEPMLTNTSVIALGVLVVLYGAHLIAQHFKWNDEQWEGIVNAAIIEIHSTGLDKLGPAWLVLAEDAFEKHYEATHGVPPSATDLRDGVLDMAKAIGPQALAATGQYIADKLTSKGISGT